MTDQLDLSLTGDVARLPRSMRPMMPRPAVAAFDSDEHVFEPRWGGRRVLAFIEPDGGRGPRLRLLDDLGRDLAPLLPELGVLADLVSDRPLILDGEIVIPDRAGRMDEEALANRLAEPAPGVSGMAGSPAEGNADATAAAITAATAAGAGPPSTPIFLVFDLLWAAGRPIIAQPLQKRRERLARILHPSPELVLLPGVVGEGTDLYFAVAQQGLRGVMARHLRSPYLPGRKSALWRSIATQPGEIALHVLPEPIEAPAFRPVLALIQRLPFED